jgi:hypothetical protein
MRAAVLLIALSQATIGLAEAWESEVEPFCEAPTTKQDVVSMHGIALELLPHDVEIYDLCTRRVDDDFISYSWRYLEFTGDTSFGVRIARVGSCLLWHDREPECGPTRWMAAVLPGGKRVSIPDAGMHAQDVAEILRTVREARGGTATIERIRRGDTTLSAPSPTKAFKVVVDVPRTEYGEYKIEYVCRESATCRWELSDRHDVR